MVQRGTRAPLAVWSGRAEPLGARRVHPLELVAWLERRRDRWPTSANPHLLVNTYTVGGIKPVSRSFVHHACRRLGLSAHQLRVDRLLAEVRATAGDPLAHEAVRPQGPTRVGGHRYALRHG
jgi:hypothetical protein